MKYSLKCINTPWYFVCQFSSDTKSTSGIWREILHFKVVSLSDLYLPFLSLKRAALFPFPMLLMITEENFFLLSLTNAILQVSKILYIVSFWCMENLGFLHYQTWLPCSQAFKTEKRATSLDKEEIMKSNQLLQ